jgi:hypothetical protein
VPESAYNSNREWHEVARLAFNVERLRRVAECWLAQKLAPIPHNAESAIQLLRQIAVGELA